jgi:hypothetical protein
VSGEDALRTKTMQKTFLVKTFSHHHHARRSRSAYSGSATSRSRGPTSRGYQVPLVALQLAEVSSWLDIVQAWDCKGKFIYVVLDNGIYTWAVYLQDDRHARWYFEVLDLPTDVTHRIYATTRGSWVLSNSSYQELQAMLAGLGPRRMSGSLPLWCQGQRGSRERRIFIVKNTRTLRWDCLQ